VKHIESHLFVIIGATGDLTSRKLLPSLYAMAGDQGLEDRCRILGVATSELTDEAFRESTRDALRAAGHDDEDFEAWSDRAVHYQCIRPGYDALKERIEALEQEYGMPGNRVFYLALPPRVFSTAIEGLGDAGLAKSPGWTRLVVEKPFGRDLESARELNKLVHEYFDESQVYRIDHYLGKETVQNLLVLRFANSLFESSWNRDRVKSVQISVAEDLGVEHRAGYYEHAGALRDMVQNHLTQVMTLVAMEPPASLEADAIRNEKVKVLQSIQRIDPEQVVVGRYGPGTSNGSPVVGYLEEDGVAADSTTGTFVAMRVDIDNWRWQGVPFYLRTGKRLPRRLTQIAIEFYEPPVCLFDREGLCQVHSNTLVITLQPHEGFELLFDVKAPEERFRLITLPLDFFYEEAFGPLPAAYTTLIKDLLSGDQTLFVRADEVEESWRLFTPLLARSGEPDPYPAGSWGPEASERLPALDGNAWVVR